MLEFLENKSTCLYSRKIFALIDTNQIHTFSEHLAKCSNCRENYAKIKAVLQLIDRKIPMLEMSAKERQQSEQYLAQLLRTSHKKKGLLSYLPW